MGPIENQLREPFLIVPIPGIKTKISKRKAINKIILMYL